MDISLSEVFIEPSIKFFLLFRRELIRLSLLFNKHILEVNGMVPRLLKKEAFGCLQLVEDRKKLMIVRRYQLFEGNRWRFGRRRNWNVRDDSILFNVEFRQG